MVLDHDLPVCGVKERLRAAGADLKRVTLLTQSVRTVKGERCVAEIDIGRQLDLIEQAVTQVPDCRLVVVDRICLDADRPAGRLAVHIKLRRLRELARRMRVAVVAVLRVENCGLAQTPELPLRRGLTAAATNHHVHSLWAVIVDRQDPARRMLLPWKNVWGPADVGFAFRFESAAQGGVRLRWDDEPVSVALLRGTVGERARLEDVVLVRRLLAAGPIASLEFAEVLTAHGMTLFRARRVQALAGALVRPDRQSGTWQWGLEEQYQPDAGSEAGEGAGDCGLGAGEELPTADCGSRIEERPDSLATENTESTERTRNVEPQMHADQRR